MKSTIIDDLGYDRLLEMASAFQWLPEKKTIRLADRDLQVAHTDEILSSLNDVAARISMIEMECLMSGKPLHYLTAALSFHFGSVRVGNEDILAIAADLADRVGLDLALIGYANFYTISYALHVRSVYPDRWNRFCDRVNRPAWKTTLQTITQTGLQVSINLAESTDLEEGEIDTQSTGSVKVGEGEKYTGLATALENPDFKSFYKFVMRDTGCEEPTATSAGSDDGDFDQKIGVEVKKKKGPRGL